MAVTAIVVLNFNSLEFLKEFLPELIHFSPKAEVWVIDNASKDGSKEFLQANTRVKTVFLAKNFGFAGGYNEGLKHIEADNYILVNSDILVSNGWIDPILKRLQDSEVGAVMPKIKSYQNRDFFDYAGAAGGELDFLGYPFCRGRILDKVEEDFGQYDKLENQEIFWASGACFGIRRQVFREMGGFDASLFAHMEEIDLCWRLKSIGYRNYICTNSEVWHVGGGTLNASSPFKTFLNFRNSLIVLTKNLSWKTLLWLIPLRLCLDGIAGINFFFQGKFSFVWSIVKAHFAYYYRLLTGKIELGRVHAAGRFPKSTVLQFYLKKKKTFSELCRE